jgi:hypothetical protein
VGDGIAARADDLTVITPEVFDNFELVIAIMAALSMRAWTS